MDKIYANKIRMTNDGCYQIKTGRYFGQGMPVYHIQCGDLDDYIRANTRTEAVMKFKKHYYLGDCE